ncbi:MAG: electron transport complex subunit RsxC [Desulfuromonas sp.]|nr:MAG: electron transport complex subunit RsxC [Desulfuromonas sp.]
MALKTFPGGVHPPDNKQWSAHLPIEECPLPNELVIPLSQHIGAPAELCVDVGACVGKGDLLGRAKGFVSVPVHASTSGEVVAVEARPHPSGRDLPAIILRPDGEDRWGEILPEVAPESLTREQTLDRIRDAGVVGMGGATFPAHVKLMPPEDKPIDTLILNGVECEPYLTADHRLMLERPERIVVGAEEVANLLGVSKLFIGIENNKPDAIETMREAARDSRLKVVPLQVKYPQGAEKQLIKAILGREVPSGGLPMDVGVVVQNVGTIAALHQAVKHGMPLIERITTVTGPGIATPKNLRVRIGTPLQHLVEYCGGTTDDPGKLIMGGPMMGMALLNLEVPVTRGTSGLLLLREKDVAARAEGPCIRCARCVLHCPAHLLPTAIAASARLEMFDQAAELRALDCIECGCCSFDCPAALPLVQSIRTAKAAIIAARRKA